MAKGRVDNLAGDLVDALGQALDVVGGDAGDRDAAVLGSIHRVLEDVSRRRRVEEEE